MAQRLLPTRFRVVETLDIWPRLVELAKVCLVFRRQSAIRGSGQDTSDDDADGPDQRPLNAIPELHLVIGRALECGLIRPAMYPPISKGRIGTKIIQNADRKAASFRVVNKIVLIKQ